MFGRRSHDRSTGRPSRVRTVAALLGLAFGLTAAVPTPESSAAARDRSGGKAADAPGEKRRPVARAQPRTPPPAQSETPPPAQPETAEETKEPDDSPSTPGADPEVNFATPRDLTLLSRDEMVSLAAQYQEDIEKQVGYAEVARDIAYQSRDMIKLTCIEDKLLQLRLISNTLMPRFKRVAQLRVEDFRVRIEFMVISPQWKRAKELRGEVETCIGAVLDQVSELTLSQEVPEFTGPDPTIVPSPGATAERVPEASPYR